VLRPASIKAKTISCLKDLNDTIWSLGQADGLVKLQNLVLRTLYGAILYWLTGMTLWVILLQRSQWTAFHSEYLTKEAMSFEKLKRAIVLVLAPICFVVSVESEGASEAPRGVPWPATWASGNKEFVSSSFESRNSNGAYSRDSLTAPISKVWVTGAQGVVSEVFWPTLDRKQIRDWQFLVTSTEGLFFEERTDSESRVEWAESGVPAFVVESWDKEGRFKLVKKIFSDPDRHSVLCELTVINSSDSAIKVFSLVNPALANTPYGDTALAEGDKLFANQETDWLFHSSFPSFQKTSVGHSGTEDPFQDLRKDLVHDGVYKSASDGNVVLMGELPLVPARTRSRFQLTLSFGDTQLRSREEGLSSLRNFETAYLKFVEQWQEGLRILPPLTEDAKERELARASYSVLRMLEDKTFEGAFIASPSVPWGLLKRDDSSGFSPRHISKTRFLPEESQRAKGIGAYHLVWPRDLFQMAQSFLAVGDGASAVAAMRYLKGLQFGPQDGVWNYGPRQIPKAGAFVQNAWLHGEAYWRMLQIDQVAYPIILASRLIEADLVGEDEFKDMILAAADFLEFYGPWSFQERWEENSGVTPSGVSVQIRALLKASRLADEWGLARKASLYRKKAEFLDGSLEDWTFTRSGTVGDGNYFLRVVGTSSMTAPWNPNSWARIRITNGGDWLLEKEVLDGGFLELVRNGVRGAWDSFVVDSLEEYDLQLRRNISGNAAFTRYLGDRYNWDERSGRQTAGMPWPFLTGERAVFEIERAKGASSSGRHFTDVAEPLIDSFSSFASSSLMFPEQVWEEGEFAGQGTGAATPLGWAHGEYLQVLQKAQKFRQSLDSE
jgi:glucoamylase